MWDKYEGALVSVGFILDGYKSGSNGGVGCSSLLDVPDDFFESSFSCSLNILESEFNLRARRCVVSGSLKSGNGCDRIFGWAD